MKREKERAIIGLQERGEGSWERVEEVIFDIYIRGSTVRISTTV